MPFLGTLFYFLFAPRFFPLSVIEAKLFAIVILTIFIPIIFAFLLKNLKMVKSIQLKKLKERRIPLLFFALLITTINNFILQDGYPELFYFFNGILFSTGIAFILSFFKIKVSLHMIGISGLVAFIMGLSLLYGINLLVLISFLILAMGWTASSRLSEKAHSLFELILGFVVGVLPQVLFFIAESLHYKM